MHNRTVKVANFEEEFGWVGSGDVKSRSKVEGKQLSADLNTNTPSNTGSEKDSDLLANVKLMSSEHSV